MSKVSCRPPKRDDNRAPVIVVSGPPGSGKSTYAKLIAKDFCLNYLTTGSLFRSLALKEGLSLSELSRRALEDPSIDLAIDKWSLEKAKEGGLVIDSHLAGWVLEGLADIRIMVTAPLSVRLERIMGRDRKSKPEVVEETLEREYTQLERFYKYYGYDTSNTLNFDLVINTSSLTIEEVYTIIRNFIEIKLKKLGFK